MAGSARAAADLTVRRLRSVPWGAGSALVVFLLPWVVLPVVVVTILALAAPDLPAFHSYLDALNRNDPTAAFGLVVVDAVGSFAAIGYYLHKYQASWRDLGFRSFNFGRAIVYLLGIVVVFGLLVQAAYTLVQLLDPGFNVNQPQTNEFTTHISSNLSLWALVVIPPILEESVFRGFMFPAFSKRFGVIAGAILTSLLFGFAHLQGNVGVYTFLLGLLLCWLYVRMGSIIPGIILHMLNNYIAYVAILHH